MQKQPPEKFCKTAILQKFAIFTGQHLCWRPFLIQNITKFFRAPFLKNICERLLLKMFMKLRKVKNCWIRILTLYEKQNFSTSVSETSDNVYLFVFISCLVSFGVCFYIQYFFGVVEKTSHNKCLYWSWWKEDQKFNKTICHKNVLQILTNEKHFPKNTSQEEFDYGFFYKFTETCRLRLLEVSYLYWQNRYPNLKTTCHVKLKFLFWTKLLESLLLAKYLISVAATLIKWVFLISFYHIFYTARIW